MEARNSDGSWAGEDVGWTEGDHWAYSLDVMVGLILPSFVAYADVDIARCTRIDRDHGW
jgi:hypothetical protein